MRRAAIVALAFGLSACLACTRGFGPPPAWELPPPPAPEAPVVQPGALHRAELANGLLVLVLEDRRLPRVSISLSFPRGEGMLDREQAGLASFTAELMKRGAGDRDALELAEYVDQIGASLQAGAGWDSLEVGVAGLSRDLDRLLEILSDVVLRPRFDVAEAEKARGQRLAALERAKADPGTLMSWYMARTLYAGHRFEDPASGTPESVASLDAASARAFHARTLVPRGAVLSVAGDVSAQDFLARAEAAFGSWSGGDPPALGQPPSRPAPPERRVVIVNRPDQVQARIAIAHDGIERTAPDRLPTFLMNSVMGGSGFSSRMMQSLRAEAGLTYGVYSHFALRRHSGPFVASTSTRVEEADRAITLMLAELERARSQPPSEAELAAARSLMVGRFSLGLESSSAVLSSLVDLEIYDLPRDSLDTYRTRVRAVTREECAQAALDHLHPDRAAIVLVGPAETLRPKLERFGPVEVIEP